MRIRGCLKPVCSLCKHSEKQKISEKLFCSENQNDTPGNSSCSKFEYDIFKYSPSAKNDLKKFSKEDFEI
ncbi:MAG: hypothetical protein IJN40_00880 [Clostridia bacterium]|nr:hypothetical protein [Clostridia bacterium]